MATAPANLDDTRRRAREATGDLRERLEGLEPVVRERLESLEPVVRERWSDLEPVVRERWEELEPRVRQRMEELEPATRQAQIGLWRGLRVLFGALAVLPGLLLKGLRLLAGTADEVADRGQQVGQEAMKRRRAAQGIRMRRRTLVAVLAGSVGAGAAAGWWLGRRTAEAEQEALEGTAHRPGVPTEDGASAYLAPPEE